MIPRVTGSAGGTASAPDAVVEQAHSARKREEALKIMTPDSCRGNLDFGGIAAKKIPQVIF
jgi:hypothetical protein